jgi:PAS domain S-box-containing protein
MKTSARRRAREAALHRKFTLTEDIFDAVPVALAVRDVEGRYLFVNRTWEKYFGTRRRAVIGRTLRERLPQAEAETIGALDRAALARGPGARAATREFSFRGKRIIQTRRVMAGARNRAAAVLVASLDISERHAVEQALADERQRLALVVRATQAGIVDWDTSSDAPWYSDRLREMLGYPAGADRSPPRSILESIHPDDRERFRQQLLAELKGDGEPDGVQVHRPMEFRLLRADGSVAWVQSLGLTVRDATGRAKRYLAAVTDISARRAQEERLRDQVALTEAIVAQIPNAVFVKDREGRFTLVNPGWSEMSGFPAPQAVGRTVHDLYPRETAERFAAEDARLLAQGAAAQPIEALHQGPRSPDQWRIVRKRVLSREDGTVLGLVCTSTDISELKRVESELRDQMLLTRALIDGNPSAMYLKDTRARYVTVNDAWLRMVGVTREQAIGRTVLELFPEKESEKYYAEDMRLLAQGEGSSEVESLRTGPDGKPQWVIVRKAVLRRADGTVIGLIGANTDITRLKRYEHELAERAKFIGELVDAMPISVAMRDTEGRYVLVNRTWERYFGVKREDALGRRRRELPGWGDDPSRRQDAEEIERLDREILARGPDYVPEPQETLRLGRHYFITRRALFDSGGSPIGVVSAGFDTTERHAMEEALKESVRLRDEVERMSRHDLKTPLNSVIALSRLLRESGKLAPEDDELLSIIERAGYRILNMVNLSLDLFRMEQGSYQFRPQPIDLADVLGKAAADLESQAASKDVAVRVRQEGRPYARAEELLCYSMFANLLKNAIEAAPEGTEVSATIRTGGGHVRVDLHNAGAVPEEIRGRFFEKYVSTGKSGGLGLGTYSARLMARVQGGDITLRSSAQEGTTVTVSLGVAPEPFTVAARASPQAARAAEPRVEELPPLRVLLVDDDEFNRLALRRYLPSPPLAVEMAVNGRAALRSARRQWPDVVFLDLEMPVMNGYKAARKLRELERAEARRRCRIIAISSNDDSATIERALAAGCDQYLVKPAPRETLLRLLAGASAPAAAAAAGAPEPAPSDEVRVDADLRARMPEFLASRRAVLDQMPQALASGDRVLFRRLAHRLAGSFALYGFRWAALQCKELEADAERGEAKELAERAAAVRGHLDTVVIRAVEAKAQGGSE